MSDLPPLDQLDLDGMAPRTRAQRASLPVDLFGSSDGSADHSLPSEGLASLPNPSETLADLSQPSDDLANPPDPSGDLASLSQLGANPTGAPAAAADSEELSSDTDNSSSNENSGGSHIDLSDLVQGSAAIYSRGRLSRTQWASAKAGINSRDTFKIVVSLLTSLCYLLAS